MLELHGWLTVYPTYEDEDKHPEIKEQAVYQNVENLLAQCGIEQMKRLKALDGSWYIDVSYFSNRPDSESDKIINTFKKIAEVAPGSYGLIYVLDDEDTENSNNFKVLVIKRGKYSWQKDILLSPCMPELYDEIS